MRFKTAAFFGLLTALIWGGLFASMAKADTVTLNQAHDVEQPQATKMSWRVILIDQDRQLMKVQYRWIAADESWVKDWNVWRCENTDDKHPKWAVGDCVAAGDPHSCCTGAGTGTCDDPDTCFSDVFSFSIRSQDVGTAIGVGLRNLMWNQFKQDDILAAGNDGTFQ